MKPFQRPSHGDERTLTLQLSQADTMELLVFLECIGDHFAECADEHLRNGEHEARLENLEIVAIAERHWLKINHQSIFGEPSESKLPPC